ncbi:hypothetical protein QJS66_22620 [Kocuria rhizophila]|nr:hypothetical protein QJS66_22620 [Kocuria rhizophila]
MTGVAGDDFRQARGLLASSLNAVADVLGAESGADSAPPWCSPSWGRSARGHRPRAQRWRSCSRTPGARAT